MCRFIFFTTLLSFFIFSNLNAQNFKATKGKVTEIFLFDGGTYQVFPPESFQCESVEVSSTLKSKSNRYQKSHLTDNNASTAWVEGVEGNGIGEKITFTFKDNTAPEVIAFEPGYLSKEETWYKNNRVAAFKMKFLKADKSVIAECVVDIAEKGEKVDYGRYSVNVSPLYLQNMAFTEFITLEIEILRVDDIDSKYNDTCISGFTFYTVDFSKMKRRLSPEEYQKEK
jgi:hypothetical protein